MMIRLSMGHVDEYDERVAAYATQLGLRSVQLHDPANLPADRGYWAVSDLRALRERCERDGLRLEGLENVPAAHFASSSWRSRSRAVSSGTRATTGSRNPRTMNFRASSGGMPRLSR